MSRYTDFVLDRWNGIEAQRAEKGDEWADHWVGVARRLLEANARKIDAEQSMEPPAWCLAQAELFGRKVATAIAADPITLEAEHIDMYDPPEHDDEREL